jgi:hypothetical protein
MATAYELRVLDPYGNAVAKVDRPISLTYTLSVNAVGSLTLRVPRDAIPDVYVTADTRIEVWRRPDGGAYRRESDGPWLMQTDTRGQSERDGRYRQIKAETINTLLDRRAASYFANTSQTQKSGPADDVMKAIVRENLGSSANASPISPGSPNPSRDWSVTGFTVDTDTSQGPSTSKGFAWQNVLSTLQAISRDAATLGTPIYFDIVSNGTGYAFRTFVGVRGIDRSISTSLLIVSAERGNLGETVEATTDWSDAATTVIAGGQGQDAARVINFTYDTARISQSPWGDRELFIDRTQLSDTTSLLAEARAELRRHRPQKILSGTLLSLPGAVYGLDWGFGDKLVAEFEQESFTARVDSVTVSLQGDEEKVTAQIKSDIA